MNVDGISSGYRHRMYLRLSEVRSLAQAVLSYVALEL